MIGLSLSPLRQFVSAEAEVRFHDSVTQHSGIKERGFDIDVENARDEEFQRVIQSRGWQLFYKHPKAAVMTVVRKFFAIAVESTSSYAVFVRGKHVRYDAGTINQLFRLPYNPSGPNELDYLMDSTIMEEVSNEICKSGGTRWTIVRDEHAHFLSKDLQQNMKVWHCFIYGKLVPTIHTSEVTKERVMLLYGIQKGMKINVGSWINSNIRHTIRQGFGGIPHPTLLTELIASQGIDTTSQEVLQPKGPLNLKAIEQIVTFEL